MIIYFFLATTLSLIISFSLYRLSLKYKLVDYPGGRKQHDLPTPNIGGVAIYFAFWIVIGVFILQYRVQGDYLKYLGGLLAGSIILFITGVLDDRKNLPAGYKIIAQIAAALTVIASGIGISSISFPLGGAINLSGITIPVITIGEITYNITLIADLIVLAWIIVVINTMNFLDGLDGLAGGVSAIAFFVIATLSQSPVINQPLSAIIALIALGAVIGFLPFNIPKAKMFMGDAGSTFLGFLLAVLAVIAGSKLATALLVFGLPIFDAIWVIISRLMKGKKPWTAGRDHLHHKLMALGVPQYLVTLIFWLITAIFGGISLFTAGTTKFILLCFFVFMLVITMVFIDIALRRKEK